MFIESLTPEQLLQFAELVILASFFGALLGANLGGLFYCLARAFGWGARKLFGEKKSDRELMRDLARERVYLLMRARTCKLDIRKLQKRQSLASYAG